jgi:hypothetical protein
MSCSQTAMRIHRHGHLGPTAAVHSPQTALHNPARGGITDPTAAIERTRACRFIALRSRKLRSSCFRKSASALLAHLGKSWASLLSSAAMAPALGSCKLVRRRPTGAAATALLLLLLIVVAPSAARAARKEKKGAKITLQAKWQGTPLVHEAAEFLVGCWAEPWCRSHPVQLCRRAIQLTLYNVPGFAG